MREIERNDRGIHRCFSEKSCVGLVVNFHSDQEACPLKYANTYAPWGKISFIYHTRYISTCAFPVKGAGTLDCCK